MIEQNLLQSIRSIISVSRERVYRATNTILLETYWQIGKIIIENEQQGKERAEYGKQTLKLLAEQLTIEFGKGFDYTNLTNMRRFYFSFPIFDAVRQELSWTHYRILSRIENNEKKEFYINESINSHWNSRTLERQVNSFTFERKVESQGSINSTENTIQEFLKDPYIFDFLGFANNTKISEFEIETAILNHIQEFLLELGKGFAFVARQKRINTETKDFYIDLVFYNYILKCFVVIDLKTTELNHQDIGQLDMYVRMYDDLYKSENDNPTIGILLCSEKDETIVKYSVLSDKNKLFASKYMLYLPKEEELKEIIEKDKLNFRLNKN